MRDFTASLKAFWMRQDFLRICRTNVVKGPDGPIMSQLTLFGIFGFHLRIHRFYRGDGELFHTHPRGFVSVCLVGSYHERLCPDGERLVKAGTVTIRKASDAHNVTPVKFPCVTLAITTPVINKWRKLTEGECHDF